jgi:hypothetical protein
MTTIIDRAKKNYRVDPATAQRIKRDRVARETAERIAVLRRIVFRNAARNRDVAALRSEPDAARLLASASNQADSFLVLAILHTAIDNRWNHVVRAGIRYFGDHPVAARVQELWDLTLTADRTAV